MKKLSATLSTHLKNQTKQRAATQYKPFFFRLSKVGDRKKFMALIKQPGVKINDGIFAQVAELVKIMQPGKNYTPPQLEEAVKQHIGERGSEAYGVWVYYPWSQRLVHLLDKKEFILVRTSRNQHKITPTEQNALMAKKIGVIGLSVGQSVSVTLAMERICGELRLADFDKLELTNLNRIRTGVHNLGLPKVYSVAREIAEIDPFMKVVCYPKGLTEGNMNTFFTRGGKLDLVVEESDGFDIKILCRYKARELKIPVIMEASDRCMVDVERFDLEPSRPILHGLVQQLDISTLRSLKTTEEKIPYMLDVLGIQSTSPRLKASMFEINHTITTWPQLASAVTMGGGIAADVSRRILLSQFNGSGRYYVDIEALIGSETENKQLVEKDEHMKSQLPYEEVARMAGQDKTGGEFIDPLALEKIVEAAIQAPSFANLQPWKWMSANNQLFLFYDTQYSAPFFDAQHHNSYLSLGAALENGCIKAEQLGYKSSVHLFPQATLPEWVAHVRFEKISADTNAGSPLAPFIGKRCTNRQEGHNEVIKDGILEELQGYALQTDGMRLSLVSDKQAIESIARINGKCERMKVLHPEAHKDYFLRTLKQTGSHCQRYGIAEETLAQNPVEEITYKALSDPKAASLLNQWEGGRALENLSVSRIASSSAIGLITMPKCSPQDYINAGRALEKTWLAATKNNLDFQPICLPLAFLKRAATTDCENHFSGDYLIELKKIKEQLNRIFNDLNDREAAFLFRLFYSVKPNNFAVKKTLNEVYFLRQPV